VAAASGAETQAVLDELSSEIDRLSKENAALRHGAARRACRWWSKGCCPSSRRRDKYNPKPTTSHSGTRPPNGDRCGGAIPASGDYQPICPASASRWCPQLVAPLHDLRYRDGADRCGHHRGAGLRTGVVCNPGICATEVRLCALPGRRGAGGPAGASHRKGTPGPGLLAHVLSSKCADHLPLHRLEQIFERHGVQITRRTLSEWNGTVADLLEPSVRAMYGDRCANRRGFNATTRPLMCRTRVVRQRFGPGICGCIGVSWARWCTTV